MKNGRPGLAFASVFLTVAFPAQLLAAELEEVIVTATKRGDIDVQSIAAGIYALSGSDLDNRAIVDFEGFAGSVPGLQFQDLGPGDKEYIIRGINGNGPAVVGTYFDEYVISASDQQDGGGKNAPIKLVDLERVEVLNGPQGTLYGANSMAGNIKFITRKPDSSAFDAWLDSDLGDTREGGFNYTVSGAINVPVVKDKFGLRLVGWRTDADGWIDQPRLQTSTTTYDGNAEDINDEETNGGRVLLRFTPNDRMTVDAMYLHQKLETGGSPRFTASGVPAWPDQPPEIASLPGNTGFAPLPGLAALTPDEDFINSDITRNTRDDEVDLFGATAQFHFDAGTFTVSASHFDHDIDFLFDSTPILLFFGVPAAAITHQPQSYETDMAEARFSSDFEGPFNFIAGLYYQKDDNDFEVRVPTTDGAGGLPAVWDPLNANDFFANAPTFFDDGVYVVGTTFFARDRHDEVKQQAAFTEITYDFTDRLQLLVGARYFDVEQESIQSTIHAFFGGLSQVGGEVIGQNINGNDIGRIRIDDDTVRPKVSLSYKVRDDVMVYGLYSEGFRVGGVNNSNQPFAPGIPATFESDELNNVEFGFKSRLLDNTLQLNAALFLIDWKDIQVEPRDPAGNIPFTTNGGEAEVNGLEWALTWLPVPELTLNLSGTWFIDHALTEDQPVLPGASPFVIVGQDGDEIPNVPEYQLFGSARYETELLSRPLSLTADVTHRDDTNTEFRTSSPFNIALDSYTLVDLFTDWELTDNFSIGLYVRNVTDELAVYDGIGAFQDPEAIVAARPRTYGALFRFKY
jgi:outer membrane receptor protein involved in Fe transport